MSSDSLFVLLYPNQLGQLSARAFRSKHRRSGLVSLPVDEIPGRSQVQQPASWLNGRGCATLVPSTRRVLEFARANTEKIYQTGTAGFASALPPRVLFIEAYRTKLRRKAIEWVVVGHSRSCG